MINVRDCGAWGQGADDTQAFKDALAGGAKGIYVPAGTYVISQVLTPPNDVTITLDKSAVIKPTNGIQLFRKTALPPSVTVSVTKGASIGSVEVEVASRDGLQEGQAVTFATTARGGTPPSWNRIRGINGRVVALEEPLPVTYGGAVTLRVQPLHRDFRLFGGTIDLTSVQGVESPALIAIDGYTSAEIDGTTFRGPYDSTNVSGLIALGRNRRAAINNCHAEQVVCFGAAFAIGEAKRARISNCTIDGDCFGTYIGSCDYDETVSIVYTGRYATTAPALRSVRAVKVEGGRHSIISNVTASDCETVIEFFSSGRARISNIMGVNIGLRRYRGQTALTLAAAAPTGELHTIGVDGVVLENLGGIGIQVGGDNTGRIIMSNINIKDCAADAIMLDTLNVMVSGAVIENWNTQGVADRAGIRSQLSTGDCALHFNDIMFVHSERTRPCFSIRSGPQYQMTNISTPNGNPLFHAQGIDGGAQNRFHGSVAGVRRDGASTQVAHVGVQTPFTVPNEKAITFDVDGYARLILVESRSGGQSCLVFLEQASASTPADMLRNASGFFAITAAPSGQVGIWKPANSKTVTIRNASGASADLSVCVLGTTVSATTDPS